LFPSDPPGELHDIALKLGQDSFLPNPYNSS
jgi:hypothetical protein